MVWGKGWEELLDMLELQRDREAEASVDFSAPHIDAFGSGEAEHAVRKSKTGDLYLWLAQCSLSRS